MSIQSEINRIKEKIAQAYTAITARHGTIPENEEEQNLNNLTDSIKSIRAAELLGPHGDYLDRVYDVTSKSIYKQGERVNYANLRVTLVLSDLSKYPYKNYAWLTVVPASYDPPSWDCPSTIPNDAFGPYTLKLVFSWNNKPYEYRHNIVVSKGITSAGVLWEELPKPNFPEDDTNMYGAGIYYSNGIYLLVPDVMNLTYVYRSTDLINWEKAALPDSHAYENYADVICDPETGKFYLYNCGYRSIACYSEDCITWTENARVSEKLDVSRVYCGAVLHDRLFLIVDYYDNYNKVSKVSVFSKLMRGVVNSIHSMTWGTTPKYSFEHRYEYNRAKSSGTCMIVTSAVTNHYIRITYNSETNAYNYTEADLENVKSVIDITHGDNGFIALVKTTDNRITIIRTSDGVTWTPAPEDSAVYSLPTTATSIIYGNGMYIVSLDTTNPNNDTQPPKYELIYFSADGITWDCEYRASLKITGAYNTRLQHHRIAYNPDQNIFVQVAGANGFEFNINTLRFLRSVPPEESQPSTDTTA